MICPATYKRPGKIPLRFWAGFPIVKGRQIFIKPNLVMPPTKYESASCTRIEVVRLVIEKCLNEGAKPGDIIVGDCGFKDQWELTMECSGYRSLETDYGVKVICVQEGENYHKYTLHRIPGYMSLFGIKISDFVLNADVVIDVPKMKIHNTAGITGAIKNMMGVISPKGSMHPNGSAVILHKRLRDLYTLMRSRVGFIVLDAIEGSEYAECGGIPVVSNVLVSGTDMWEVDCILAQLMGINPVEIQYLEYIRTKDKGAIPFPKIPVVNKPAIITYERR